MAINMTLTSWAVVHKLQALAEEYSNAMGKERIETILRRKLGSGFDLLDQTARTQQFNQVQMEVRQEYLPKLQPLYEELRKAVDTDREKLRELITWKKTGMALVQRFKRENNLESEELAKAYLDDLAKQKQHDLDKDNYVDQYIALKLYGWDNSNLPSDLINTVSSIYSYYINMDEYGEIEKKIINAEYYIAKSLDNLVTSLAYSKMMNSTPIGQATGTP